MEYETLLTELGDGFGYRVRYLKGILEITSPSQRHESYKKLIAMLLETYSVETGINFYPLGSTTLRNVASVRGVEPDECYCLHENKPIPVGYEFVRKLCFVNEFAKGDFAKFSR